MTRKLNLPEKLGFNWNLNLGICSIIYLSIKYLSSPCPLLPAYCRDIEVGKEYSLMLTCPSTMKQVLRKCPNDTVMIKVCVNPGLGEQSGEQLTWGQKSQSMDEDTGPRKF